MRRSHVSTVWTLRRWLVGVLVLGLVGTGLELVLLEHYEDPWQLVPLVLIAVALAVLAWDRTRPSASSARALQVTMTLFLLAGGLGVVLHFRGAAEFQLESDPSMAGWELFKKVVRAKAPPLLAPGLMVQLGLIGLVYSYRAAATPESDSDSPKGSDST